MTRERRRQDGSEGTAGRSVPGGPMSPRDPAGALEAREIILGLATKHPEAFFLQAFGPVRRRPADSAAARLSEQWPRCSLIRLSGRCNLACDYCFDAANSALRDTLELPTARTIVDYIIRVPVAEPLIGFLGGC